MTFGLRIRVDFNRRSGDGNVIASLRRASGRITIGDVVIATQPGEDMEHFARVVAIDETTGRVELEVNWESRPAAWAPVSSSTESPTSDGLLVPSTLYRFAGISSTPSFASGRASAHQPVSA